MKYNYLAIIFFITFCLFSQETKFGKVSVPDLEKKECSIDKEAAAEITYQYSRISFPSVYNEYEKEVYVRIKIYDKDKASDFLNKTINLRKGGSKRERISNFKAITYNLENGNVQETKVSNENIFEINENKYLDLYKFTFSNVKNGSVLEYKYILTSTLIWDIPTHYFEEQIPILYSYYSFEHPDFILY